MRVSTATIYDAGVNTMLKQQEALFQTQQQVSTGRRILTPSVDPIAASQALNITQTASLNTQYTVNRNHAASTLGLVEDVLRGVTTLIQDVHTTTVNAGNPTLTDSDRKSIATELRGRLDELIGLANTRDGSGQFLFSGFQGNTQPFVQTASEIQYNGDQGKRLIQVSATRHLAVSDTGTSIFERIKNGNGVFATAASPANTGTGVIDVGSVLTPGSLTGDTYQITFNVASGVTTYDVLDTTTDVPVSTGNPYNSGDTISFDGMQLSISGAPENGDQFSIAPSTNQSLFKTVNDLIVALETPANGQPGGIRLTNNLNTALQNLDHGLDHVLATRASVGARLQEIDALQNIGSDLDIQYQETLSQLQDIDFAQALSDLNRQQLQLEAAQRSFMTISGLSLFNFL